MKTAECEAIEVAGEWLDRARAARVESVEPIAGSHNVKAVVDAGPYGRKTIDGVESDGMLASAAELGINRDHTGIIELEAAIGAPVPGCAPDSVIEIDNKSITHRPDRSEEHTSELQSPCNLV